MLKLSPKTILLFLFFTILTLWGWQYFIHSSEFWTITSSKHLFDPNWSSTIELKPLLYLLLYPLNLIPMSDWQHISSVKLIFALLGSIQVILFYFILEKKSQLEQAQSADSKFVKKYLPELVTLTLVTSQFYVTQFFRIRTDQVSVLLYLACIYLNIRKSKYSFTFTVISCLFLYFLSAKSIFFLTLIIFSSREQIIQFLRRLSPSKKGLILMAAAALLIWLINLNWRSLEYWIDSLENYRTNSMGLYLWGRTDLILILLIVLATTYLIVQKKTIPFIHELIISFFFLLAVSQKYPHLIASLIPIFYLFSYSLYNYLFKKQLSVIVSIILLAVLLNHLITYNQSPFRSNWEQKHFIQSVGSFISENRLTYLDGFAIFPRQKSVNCLVSPDDPLSEKGCSDLLKNGSADLIILTPRLLPIAKDDNHLLSIGYYPIGANLFIRKEKKIALLKYKEPPALMVFAFEF